MTNALSIFLRLLLCIDNFVFSYENLFSSTAQYQPLWTFVGSGLKTLDESKRAMKEVMPENAQWIKDSVASFNPDKNAVVLANGEAVSFLRSRDEGDDDIGLLDYPSKKKNKKAKQKV